MNWGHPEQGKVLLLAGDLVLAAAAAIFATRIDLVNPAGSTPRFAEVASFMLVFSTCFYVFDLYDMRALNVAREHRPGRFHFNSDSDEQRNWKRDQKSHAREQDVRQTLDFAENPRV